LTDLERAGRKLAEAETLANDRNARNLQLAREYEGLNDRLRQELERAADAVSAKEKAEHALAELQPHLDELRESRNQLTGRLKALEGSAAEATRSMQQRDTATGRLKDELSDARKRIQELEAALASAQSDLAANGDDATDAGAHEQADALRGQLVAAQAEREMLQQQAIELQEAQRSAADLAEDRMRKLQERLELMAERTRRQDDERKLLMDALSRQEQGRVDEKSELELVAQRADKELGSAQRRVQESQDQVRALHDKLNEAESFLIARQRDLEKAEARLKEMKEAIGTVADLRAEYEATNAEGQRAKIASQISRKLDTLFAEVGRPIHADRKTEKILILHVKKSDDEIEVEKPFVATKRRGKAGPASAGGNDRAQSKRS
jgi:chromosome segregation ATPase